MGTSILSKTDRVPMKRIIVPLIFTVLFVLPDHGFSQILANGWLQSNLYSWENLNETQQWDYYQGLQLRVSPENYSNLYLNTFMRLAYRGDPADWQEKVYNLYANWGIGKNFKARVGRQFLYKGVINGIADGVFLSGRFLKNFQAGVVMGTETPADRGFEIRRWDDGSVMGGYLGYSIAGQNSIELSFYQKERWSEEYWQQLGSVVRGFVFSKLDYYARFDYNLLKSDYQTVRFRLTYLDPQWSVSGEYNSQRPRIYEDSFFNIFVINPYNQIRTAFTYRLSSYELGIQLLHTVYNASEFYILFKDDQDLKLIGTVGHSGLGSFGIIFQTGDVAENIGYYADLRYDVFSNLTARFYNSYYNYERATVNIGEDALAFMVGLSYKVKKQFIVDGELQQSSNNFYKNDLRGLFRLTYLFQVK